MSAIRPTGFFPVMTTERVRDSRDFFVRHFGFAIAFEADWYVHLAHANGTQLGFLQPDHPSQPQRLRRRFGGHGMIYSLEVDDADAAYAALDTETVSVVQELRTEPWGQRHFLLEAPGGLVIDVVQAMEPTDEYRAQYVDGAEREREG